MTNLPLTPSTANSDGSAQTRQGGLADIALYGADSAHRNADRGEPIGRSTALVVEMDPKSATVLALLLQAEGYRVLVAASGEEALTLANQVQFDLITLDPQLPGMDGWQFLLRLRNSADLVSTPVVIIAGQPDVSKALRWGAAGVLDKPLLRGELLNSLTLLGLRPNAPHPRCVLVVDDDSGTVELVRSFLDHPTYRVESSANSAAAVSDALELSPDLIMINLLMSDLQGFRIVRALQTQGATANIPLLVVSTSEITQEEQAFIDVDPAQPVAILNKPDFNKDVLLAKIERALG